MQRCQVELEEPQLALRGRGPHALFDLGHRRVCTPRAPAGEVDRRAARIQMLCGVEADAGAVCVGWWEYGWGLWMVNSLLGSGDDDNFPSQVRDIARWVVGHGRVRMWIYDALAHEEGIYEGK